MVNVVTVQFKIREILIKYIIKSFILYSFRLLKIEFIS